MGDRFAKAARPLAAGAILTLIATTCAEAQTADLDEAVGARGNAPKLELTAAQKKAIYQEVRQDTGKVAKGPVAPTVGAEVPPMIELYMLPDRILADNPAAKFYQFTRVGDEVLLVDPTRMIVVAVISPGRLD